MKTQILTFLFLFTSSCILSSQTNTVEPGNVPVSANSGGAYGSMFANLVNKRGNNYNGIVGTPYLNEGWSKGHLVVMGSEASFDEVKVNVLENVLEVRLKGAEKVLESRYLTSFDLIGTDMTTQHFVNGDHFKYEGKPLTGFVKETKVGEFSVLTRYKARWVKPDQTDKIVGGDPRDKIVQSKETYISKGDKMYQLKSKKDLQEILKRKEKKIKAFMKENKTNVKEESDLIAVLNHYQS